MSESAGAIAIDEIAIADDAHAWAALGFDVRGDGLVLGETRLRLAGRKAGSGILGWSLRGTVIFALDGLPTDGPRQGSRDAPGDGAGKGSSGPAAAHPNGVVALDHVVAFSPQLDRTVRALRDAGLDLRRVREQPTPAGAPRQAFFRLGGAILEVVQLADEQLQRAGGADGPARFWGLALLSEDIDRTAAAFGEHVGAVRPAVQPGRRIATVRRSAGLAVPVALMSAPG